MAALDDSKFFDVSRLKDLGDGIFAFAMTFLIVTIEIPRVPFEMLGSELWKMLPDLTAYLVSFFLLAVFWMTNHIQMKGVKRADSKLVWINMLLFLMIVFIPLTTDLYSFYDGSLITMLVFNLNIFLIGLVFLLQWHHLAANNIHHEDFTQEEIKDRYTLCATLIIVSLIAIAAGLFYPAYCTAVYFLMGAYRVQLRLRRIKEPA